MAKVYEKYYFKTSGGSTLIPIADGTYYTDDMDDGYTRGQVYIEFLDTNGDTATPTGGTLTFTGSHDGNQYLTGSDSVTTASNVEAAAPSSYTPPSFHGLVKKTKMVISSITGGSVTHVRAYHWRYKD